MSSSKRTKREQFKKKKQPIIHIFEVKFQIFQKFPKFKKSFNQHSSKFLLSLFLISSKISVNYFKSQENIQKFLRNFLSFFDVCISSKIFDIIPKIINFKFRIILQDFIIVSLKLLYNFLKIFLQFS